MVLPASLDSPCNEPNLPTPDASEFLTQQGYKTAPRTLSKLRCIGGGPKFRRFGRRVLYRASDLTAWAESRTSGPLKNTSE